MKEEFGVGTGFELKELGGAGIDMKADRARFRIDVTQGYNAGGWAYDSGGLVGMNCSQRDLVEGVAAVF